MFKQRDPEDRTLLLALHPSRTYTFEEVKSMLALLSGVAFDGLPLKSWQLVEATDQWFNVEVTFDNYLSEVDPYENWYFFKEKN